MYDSEVNLLVMLYVCCTAENSINYLLPDVMHVSLCTVVFCILLLQLLFNFY